MLGKLLTIFIFIVASTFLLRKLELYEGFVGKQSVSNEENYEYSFAPEELKNKVRVFKYPHYYGYGTDSGIYYGEPYYTRNVNY